MGGRGFHLNKEKGTLNLYLYLEPGHKVKKRVENDLKYGKGEGGMGAISRGSREKTSRAEDGQPMASNANWHCDL